MVPVAGIPVGAWKFGSGLVPLRQLGLSFFAWVFRGSVKCKQDNDGDIRAAKVSGNADL